MAPIMIAGGGIGGLAAALALARHGLASHVLEKRPVFSTLGAGIQISPNAMRVLQRIGVAERLQPSAGVPQAINIFNALTGRQLTQLPLGDWIARRHGAPYWVAHRRDLQQALLDAANASPLIEISTSFDVAGFTARDDHICVEDAGGRTIAGPALIGADGLWSRTRDLLFAPVPLTFSGKTAARAIVPAAELKPPFSSNASGVWLAPGAHVVHYPVRGGSEIAIVVVVQENWHGEGWGEPEDTPAVLAPLSGLAPVLTNCLETVPGWRKWALFTSPALPRWWHGRAALIGDAAHPVFPFLAQGGALALEDAMVLSDTLAATPDDPAAAFQRYGEARRQRVARVQAASRRNGDIYHMAPPASWARDLVLRMTPPQAFMSRLDWLYHWHPH